MPMNVAAYLEGLARSDAARLKTLAFGTRDLLGPNSSPSDLWRAAAFRQIERIYDSAVSAMDVVALVDLASGQVDATEVARHILDHIAGQPPSADEMPDPPNWPALHADLRRDLAGVAHRHLRILGLAQPSPNGEPVAVTTTDRDLRAALTHAYYMGHHAARSEGK